MHMPSAVLAHTMPTPSTPNGNATSAGDEDATGDADPLANVMVADDGFDDEDEDGYYAMLDATDDESGLDEATNGPSVPDVSLSGDAPASAEAVPLWLPSQLPSTLRLDDSMSHLILAERRLREAQANDAIAELRRLRRILTGISLFKHLNLDGTGGRTSTRILASYKSFQVKTQRCADRYRAAYNALLILWPNGPWSTRLQELKREDIRGPGLADDEDRRGEGQRQPSWIWLVPGVPLTELSCDVNGNEFMDGVRVEWARTRARAKRWGEEIVLLQEEMRRTVVFFEWKMQWWSDQSCRREGLPSVLQRGLACYAHAQADVYRSLAVKCAGLWLPFLWSRDIEPPWGDRYPLPTEDTADTSPPARSHEATGEDGNDENDCDDNDSGEDSNDSDSDSDEGDSEDDYSVDDRDDGDLGLNDHDVDQRQASVERDITYELGGGTL